MLPRACEYCGRPFLPGSGRQRFCPKDLCQWAKKEQYRQSEAYQETQRRRRESGYNARVAKAWRQTERGKAMTAAGRKAWRAERRRRRAAVLEAAYQAGELSSEGGGKE